MINFTHFLKNYPHQWPWVYNTVYIQNCYSNCVYLHCYYSFIFYYLNIFFSLLSLFPWLSLSFPQLSSIQKKNKKNEEEEKNQPKIN